MVAHHVSLMAVQAEAVGALLPARPAEGVELLADAIAATARQAMTELRRLLGVLRFNSADQELSPERTRLTPAPSMSRLDELLALVRASGLPVHCTISGEPTPLPPGVDLTAYRIVQEALTNALRHAPGSAAAVTVAYEDGGLSVAVTNTAPSPTATASKLSASTPTSAAPQDQMAPPVPNLACGYGLAGIAERVASCGGSLTLGPGPSGRRFHRDRPIAADVTAADVTGALRVLVADDQDLVRAGLRMILESQSDIEVVAEAADGVQALVPAVPRERPRRSAHGYPHAQARRAGDHPAAHGRRFLQHPRC